MIIFTLCWNLRFSLELWLSWKILVPFFRGFFKKILFLPGEILKNSHNSSSFFCLKIFLNGKATWVFLGLKHDTRDSRSSSCTPLIWNPRHFWGCRRVIPVNAETYYHNTPHISFWKLKIITIFQKSFHFFINNFFFEKNIFWNFHHLKNKNKFVLKLPMYF